MSLTSRIPQFNRQLERDARAAVELTGRRVQQSARNHAPGRGPEGTIGQAIEWKPDPTGLSGTVEAGDWRSHFFEFGTVKMSPRPMLTPAAEEHDGLIVRQIARTLR